jgi:hypothetical protein
MTLIGTHRRRRPFLYLFFGMIVVMMLIVLYVAYIYMDRQKILKFP